MSFSLPCVRSKRVRERLSFVFCSAIFACAAVFPAQAAIRGLRVDYDGDGKTDIAVFRPSQGVWYVIPSSTGIATSQQFGTEGDIPVAGDYDGDGKTDYAVFRPSQGTWYVILSSTGAAIDEPFGEPGDIPVPGDYDGDGKTDYAVFRPSNGTWYILQSSTSAEVRVAFGEPSDVPVPGDYDGDGRIDYGVFRPSNGTWYILLSGTGGEVIQAYGQAGDVPAPSDYDGDGKTDIGVFRPSEGNWYIIPSGTGAAYIQQFGTLGDIPVPGDYDGEGKANVAVFREVQGMWYLIRGSSGGSSSQQFGTDGDLPISTLAPVFFISGQVTAIGGSLPGVTISLSGSVSISATTDANGNYFFTLPSDGNYTVTPALSGYTFSPASQTFSNISASETANFTVTQVSTGGSAPPDASPGPPPTVMPPPVVSASATNCNDISGTWTDSNSNTYSYAQTGSSVSGTISEPDPYCATNVIWQVSGQSTGNGTLTLTDYGPSTDACGNIVGPITATVTVTLSSCSTAQVTGTGSSGPAAQFSRPRAAPATGSTTTWSRTSNPPGLQVSVDLANDRVCATPTTTQKPGSPTITLTDGSNNSSTLPQSTPPNLAACSSPALTYNLQRESLAPGQYGTVAATWDDITVTLPVAFNVLGNYRFSTFNTAYETQCGTADSDAVVAYSYSGDTCTWKIEKLNSTFMAQVDENGTGVNTAGEILKTWAVNPASNGGCELPLGLPQTRSDGSNAYYLVPKIDGACITEFSQGNPTAIAVYPNPKTSPNPLTCKDQVMMVDSNDQTTAVKTVQDYCPACVSDFRGAQGHIDTYSNSHSCYVHDLGDQGNFTAIRLR